MTSGWPRAAATALQFLTRLPVPGGASADPARFEADLPRALALFPLTGALIGTLTAATLWLASQLWPLPLAVLLALALEARLTGALHEDAVADLCDGFGGGRTPEDVLRIMKDSRIGAFGLLGLAFAIALRAAGLIALPDAATAAVALVVSGWLGRLLMLAAMLAIPPMPGRPGLGGSVASHATPRALALALLLSLPAPLLGLWWDALAMLLALLGSALFLAWFRRLVLRHLGGSTGDCFGFAGYAGLVLTTLAFTAHR
ncbi:adenosylcobinamide-GDP ribazoletransferase [Belnapia sp. T18]|uniref:Adenosylcobinamide-GDP ribazoletransferase n=1 Tax=Belnapia arida TaxID=2804533 RepID=A0ABS1U0M9_9PROT|nr:adenosylcobinamide-GDP ribazoletransferase [Belnapia arida]MBL6078237.1 adenosylcobinamide-GDP ribazoletransferase [Belnapia arida]